MKVIQENLALCYDCMEIAEQGYSDTLPEPEQADILAALEALPYLVASDAEPNEFSNQSCDCCGSRLAGERHYYNQLGE